MLVISVEVDCLELFMSLDVDIEVVLFVFLSLDASKVIVRLYSLTCTTSSIHLEKSRFPGSLFQHSNFQGGRCRHSNYSESMTNIKYDKHAQPP